MVAFHRIALPFALLAVMPVVRADEVWWSFRQLKPTAVPQIEKPAFPIRNPIDAFVLAKLDDKGFSPTPEADRRTLIRRLTFDLTGLPPTPAEVAAFLADQSPDAYEKLVDRLLASPHYGERWARHWMDLVHFAETHGHDQDRVRPNAWRYRDYLIRSFNEDVPYSRFVQEQIAADVMFPEHPNLTPALGFLAAGPWDESSLRDIRDDSIDRQVAYYLDRDDMVATVMSTFQGLTVQCARCHDHKFDPIPQLEYYRLQAVFAGIGRGDVNYDSDLATTIKRKELVLRLVASAPTLDALRDPFTRATLSKSLPPLLTVYAAAPNFTPDNSHKPVVVPRVVRFLKRGDIRKPGEVAEPGTLSCLMEVSGDFDLHANSAEGSRRAALAKWITDPKNPLTWRVIVNRIWQYHFGRGLVASPSDYGKMGQAPTHPELLDWLAAEFRDNGMSLKRLHRLIATSSSYRQQSQHDAKFAELDAENRWLWHMPRHRLDAEQIRDAILAICGRLDRTPGGPSDRQFDLRPGIHVTPIVDYGKFDWDRPQGHRRSVYRFNFRTLPDPLVDCLDGADPSQLTAKRNESVTALQALSLLNNEFVLVHSKAFAADLEKQAPNRSRQIAMACERLWSRPPTQAEQIAFDAFAAEHGLANLCRVLFNSNEFLFID